MGAPTAATSPDRSLSFHHIHTHPVNLNKFRHLCGARHLRREPILSGTIEQLLRNGPIENDKLGGNPKLNDSGLP